jgi:ribose 5-phosphate isomerase RpiB
MMALTDGDKAECKEIAREIIKEVLKEHIIACPYGKVLLASKSMLIGIGIGLTLFGAGTGIGVFTAIQKISGVIK